MSEEVPRTAALIDVSGVSLENLRRLDSVALRRVLDGLREGDEETLAAFDSAT
ncbi:FxSxx-COOH cyclophane-containing RiPP peptide [Nonomuraea lactucae]|uniref:FxSxx-COOH cyclophane-containing RiPP peptide n=1 Tax=Nonomuraea lactucae TaxID=2249762 RepID=UPI0013B4302D|nr:FxSxx-COOH cyclophane-containing RiPP peptide [Nonomuraea lactucae]